MSPRTAGRLKLALILSFFIVPVAAAWLLYLKPEFRPGGRVNYGRLVEPARALPELPLEDASGPAPAALRGKWTLVHVATRCEERCLRQLLISRQTRTLLNQNRARVQRAYVAPDAAAREAARAQLAVEHPDLVFVSDAGGGAAAFFAEGSPDRDAIQLLDPNGIWLMSYEGEVDYKGMLKDLKKLLRFSSVG